jgi:hypothetical protein
MVFESKARVQALATLFDAGTEDAQGRTYSQKRAASGLGAFCMSTITRVYRGARNTPQKYLVKWDEGTSTAIEERHLSLLLEPAEGATLTNADDEATGMSDYLTRDGELTDDKNEDDDVEGAEPEARNPPEVAEVPVTTSLNGVVQCGEFRWRFIRGHDPPALKLRLAGRIKIIHHSSYFCQRIALFQGFCPIRSPR